MFQKVFYGPITNAANKRLKDLKPWEIAMVGSLVVLAIWGGLFPNTFLKPMEASIGATRMMALNAGQTYNFATCVKFKTENSANSISGKITRSPRFTCMGVLLFPRGA